MIQFSSEGNPVSFGGHLEPIRKTLVILSGAKNLVVEMLHAVQHDGFSDRLLAVVSHDIVNIQTAKYGAHYRFASY
jgi:hypothetical protein